MKKENHCPVRIPFLFLCLLFFPLSNAANAEVKIFKLKNDTAFSISGEVTARNSHESWFQAAVPQADNDYDYFFTRSRLGLALRNPHVGIFVQAQGVHMANLPENSIAPAPQGSTANSAPARFTPR